VKYQYAVNLPDWAKTQEMNTAFPSVNLWSATRTAKANLAKADTGWSVQSVVAFTPTLP
jgi:hypothetical protein